MVRAAGAEFGQARRILGIHEAQDLFVILHRADETPLLLHLPAQPRKDRGEIRVALRLVERLVFGAAKRLRVAAFRRVLRLDVMRRLFR